MKGKMRVSVEVTNDSRYFPITDKWVFETDNTFEDVDDWIDLFEKILYAQGFAPYKLIIDDEIDEEGNYNDGEYPDEAGV